MSKVFQVILSGILTALLILQFLNIAPGQKISATILVDPTGGAARISGVFKDPNGVGSRNLSFLKQFAGIDNLAARVKNLKLADRDGADVMFRQLIPGEILAGEPYVNWHYDVDLRPRTDPPASAHVSWLSEDTGIIYLDDLLPQFSTRGQSPLADIKLDLPKGWRVFTTEKGASELTFESVDIDKAVFLIGRNLRERVIPAGKTSITLVIDGEWQFSDDDAAAITREIYDDCRKLFGADASPKTQIALIKFPVPAGTGTWEANTIGSSATVLSADMPFRAQSIQRLHEQLRHEIFHLWIPNAIDLTGNYDWFYEGFAVYASLKSGVRLNRIRFEDFLDTLSRARTIDSFQDPRLSLIEASQKRWTGGNTKLYARGMVVAFLCDLALLNNSKGKTSVSDLLKEIFARFRSGAGTDGTKAILEALKAYPEIQPVVERYIIGNSVIDWGSDLSTAGIVSEEKDSVTMLRTIEKPNARQKVLLDRLGYNSWRRIGTK